MALKYTTSDGVTLTIPGSYPTIAVQNNAVGLAVNGVLFLVGEADAGPDWTLESDLKDNMFGANSTSSVVFKYKTGNLVDGFRGAVTPSADPEIPGAPNRLCLVKTNISAKADGDLTATNLSVYGTLFDKSYGELGNLISFQVTQKTAEVLPTTGSFTYIPNAGTSNSVWRVNGAVGQTLSLAADTSPTAFQVAVDALTNIQASGGVNRNSISVAGTLALSAAGLNVTITRSVAWTNAPLVGDTLVIPTGSILAAALDENVGGYVITAVSTTTISATKLSDAGKTLGPAPVPGVVTNPIPVLATPIAVVTDIIAYSPIVISLSTTLIDGIGQALESLALTTGTDLFTRQAFLLGTTTPVTWISTTLSHTLLTSASEYAVNLNISRQVDSVSEVIPAGGQIALRVGYGTGSAAGTAALAISSTLLVTAVTGGVGTNLSVDLTKFPTLFDLAAYIDAQPGYSASVGSAAIGSFSPLGLDEGTFGIGTTLEGNEPLRLKVDAAKFYSAIVINSATVQLGNPTSPSASGLPVVMAAPLFLSGGLKGSTTQAQLQAAVDAVEAVQGNFLIPLFSRDATEDIAEELTESGSTYEIDSVNAYSKTHVLKMSTTKKKRNRQAFLSKQDDFQIVKDAAQNLASARCSLSFQDVRDNGPNGITQYPPWMTACKAAGMQAAGFYRAIFNKAINISGALMADGSFKDNNEDQIEEALEAGLLVIKAGTPEDGGGFRFVSDQTTYSRDENFVYNSIQAMYAADQVALGTARKMERAFVGQSFADVSNAAALTVLDSIMAEWRRLKLIAPSSDALKGYRGAIVRIIAPAMEIEVEIKLATAVYFVPIKFTVSEVLG